MPKISTPAVWKTRKTIPPLFPGWDLVQQQKQCLLTETTPVHLPEVVTLTNSLFNSHGPKCFITLEKP